MSSEEIGSTLPREVFAVFAYIANNLDC